MTPPSLYATGAFVPLLNKEGLGEVLMTPLYPPLPRGEERFFSPCQGGRKTKASLAEAEQIARLEQTAESLLTYADLLAQSEDPLVEFIQVAHTLHNTELTK